MVASMLDLYRTISKRPVSAGSPGTRMNGRLQVPTRSFPPLSGAPAGSAF